MGRSSRSRRSSRSSSTQSLLDQSIGLGLSISSDCVPFPGYKLVEFLGRGSYGEVWSAQDADGKKLAIKFLYCENRKGGRELRTLQKIGQLEHENLIHHHRVWCYQNYLCIGMELAQGGLDDLLNQSLRKEGKPLDKELVCECLEQVAVGLDFLNTAQHRIDGQTVAVYHCDVKPSNILVVGGSIKLTDFGLSLITPTTNHQFSPTGTTNFAAPEVFKGLYNNRTDQYALAVTYYVLRGGELPFPESPRRFDRTYVRPAPILTALTEAERPIIAKALSNLPLNRWPTCSALMAALRQAGSSQMIKVEESACETKVHPPIAPAPKTAF